MDSFSNNISEIAHPDFTQAAEFSNPGSMREKRGSGILLHITSLPSPYGIGDLGSGAYKFADFLAEARQSFWQILPLNLTCTAYGNSPYSSFSAFAGNSLLISPEQMVKDGLLLKSDIETSRVFPGKKVNIKIKFSGLHLKGIKISCLTTMTFRNFAVNILVGLMITVCLFP